MPMAPGAIGIAAIATRDGRFTRPHLSVDDMKAFVVGKMREMKFPGFLARFCVRNLHKLERWRK